LLEEYLDLRNKVENGNIHTTRELVVYLRHLVFAEALKSRCLRWAGLVARLGERRYALATSYWRRKIFQNGQFEDRKEE
jgi:hypothetical protein